MKATLTYLGHPPEQRAAIELVTDTTIVGKGALHDLGLMPLATQVMGWSYFLVCTGGTLYVGIPSDLRLARTHFAIRRVAGESGSTFRIRDLGSHCGLMVNETRNQGGDEMPLKDGDLIHYGFEFLFRLQSLIDSEPA
jgi:hypothetical protein